MAGLARSVAAAILLSWMTTLGFAADRSIIILDASGSMWGQIDGKPKLEIARESLQNRAAVDPHRQGDRLHGLWPSREGQLRRHRADRAAAGGLGERDFRRRRQHEIPRQDAADRRRQAGGRGVEIHRGQGDRHPDHRRARDVQRRPLRARQGTGGSPASTSPPTSSASA